MATHSPVPSIRTVAGGALVAIAGAMSLTGCAGEPPEVTIDDPELVAGRAVYGANCASCHGADGGGGLGTKLNEGSMVAAFPAIEDQIAVIADGRDRMPAFVGRLDDEELRAVVRYTREVL